MLNFSRISFDFYKKDDIFNIINQLKDDCKIEEDEVKQQLEFQEIKEFLKKNITS